MTPLAEFADHVVALDHTAHAVRSIEVAAGLYRDVLGGVPVWERPVEADGFRCQQFRFPNGAKIELLEPVGEDGFLARFLRRRGEGIHHLTFRVVRIEVLAAKLEARGWRVVGGRYDDPAWKEAFISPRDAYGTIVQLAESDRPW